MCVFRLASKSTNLEKECADLKMELAELNKQLLSQADLHSAESKFFKNATNITINELREEVASLSAELIASKDLVKSKEIELSKLILSFQNEEARLESKIRHEVK
jgi:hypothetical protein